MHQPLPVRIRNYCEKHGITSKVFAAWAQVSVPALRDVQMGTRYPQASTIAKILDALTRTPDEHRRRLERLVRCG